MLLRLLFTFQKFNLTLSKVCLYVKNDFSFRPFFEKRQKPGHPGMVFSLKTLIVKSYNRFFSYSWEYRQQEAQQYCYSPRRQRARKSWRKKRLKDSKKKGLQISRVKTISDRNRCSNKNLFVMSIGTFSAIFSKYLKL